MREYVSVLSDNKGIALVAVTMVMVVAALLGGAMIAQTTQDVQLAERVYEDKRAIYLGESGKERGYYEIKNNADYVLGGALTALATNVTVQGGTYSLSGRELSAAPKVVELISTGTYDGTTRTVTVISEVIRENVNVWNNAIFGGGGQTGGVVNGNCAIHGSVHLLGENVGVGVNSIEALDLNGTALIHNNYVGMPAAMAAKLPALPTTVYGGQTVSTLDAKLRVKNGAVGVSGNSEIGEANNVFNTWKETMDGIYIEEDASDLRWTGNQVTDGVPDPAHVQSDNGTNALYDLADAVHLPLTSEPYGGEASYDAYFDVNGLVLGPQPPATSVTLTLDDTNSAATYISTVPIPPGGSKTVSGKSFTITDAKGNSFGYNGGVSPAQMTITGMVKVVGNVVVGKKGMTITYDGRGTIYASGVASTPDMNGDSDSLKGDLDVHSNLVPVGTFPTNDVLGLVAKDDMNLATGSGDSQLMMAGAFYGQDKVTSEKQNEIAGTFVGEYFDMGTNVPRIYQVPSLVDNLPPGLIGDDPIWVVTGFDERSWRVD
ncbi:hypothetical protein HZA56_02320 [Candidatus Poribacteria bacterium]|nr:hypothetical protein [Candidatus Poribacteria bacterium]